MVKTNRKPPQATPTDAAMCPAREGSGRIAQVACAVTHIRAKEVGLRTARQSVAYGAEETGGWHGAYPLTGCSTHRLTIKRGGCFLFAICASDVRPIDIRPQGFALHLTVRCLLNLDASLNRNGCCASHPLIDSTRRHAKRASKCDLGACLEVVFELHDHSLALLRIKTSHAKPLGK